MRVLEQNLVEAFQALLINPDLGEVSQEEEFNRTPKGRTDCSILQVDRANGLTAIKHDGYVVVKGDLKSQWSGFYQCIGGVALQIEELWRLADEAISDSNPAKRQKSAKTEGSPSCSSNENEVIARSGRGFGLPTDWERWFGVFVVANRQVNGSVNAKVTCSGECYWRRTGPEGMTGLLRVLAALMLPELKDLSDEEWVEKSRALENQMEQNSFEVLKRCGLSTTKRAEYLQVRVAQASVF